MNPLVLLSAVLAVSQAAVIAPYGLPYAAGLPYGAGLPYAAGLPYGAGLPYAAGSPYLSGAPLAAPYLAGAPIAAAPIAAAPIAAAPLNPSSQFQAQDEFGNIQYGYSNINSAKHEVGNTYGGVSGSYSYVDANGQLQTTNYIADALGFRVQATNLPVAPSANLEQPTFNLIGPAPVEDTDEVKAAKAEFQAAFDEAAARTKRSTPAATSPLLPAAPLLATHPLNYAGWPSYAYANHAYGYNTLAAPGYAYNTLAAPAYGYNTLAAAPALAYNTLPSPALAYNTLPAPALAYNSIPAAGIVASAPATREATLTTIKLNPGHATAYKVE